MNDVGRLAILLLMLVVPFGLGAADWPQFMRNAQHTGDAADEDLKLLLGLATCVRLDDAIFASPAIVGGRVYAVDQMGTVYAVDPKANTVLWKTAPDGEKARGGNAGSPCVVQGRVYVGSTTGRVHILNAADGKVVASVDVGSAVPGSLTHANDAIYLQTLEARVIKLSLDGKIVWTHDHRRDYQFTGRPASWPVGYHKDQFGGGEIAVSGQSVVANLGCDLFCLTDKGGEWSMAWCHRNPVGCMGPAICGEWVYVAQPNNDGQGGFRRVKLADGSFDPKTDQIEKHWLPFVTPAVRDQTVFVQSHSLGMLGYDFAKSAYKWKAWDSANWKEGCSPGVASAALSREHCVFATVHGELLVVAQESTGGWMSGMQPVPFRFATPSRKVIASAPAVSGGAIYFGSDDGRLYGLAAGGTLDVSKTPLPEPAPRVQAPPATGKNYFLNGPYGGPSQTCTIDDPKLKPPFRVRWVAPSLASFKQPMVCGEEDVYFSSLEGMSAAYDQATGRLRWRRRLDGPGWCRQGPSYADGRLFVPRPGGATKTNALVPGGRSLLYCLDAADGSTKWTAELGGSPDPITRIAPVYSNGVVAYPSLRKQKLWFEAWDSKSGELQWKVELAAIKSSAGVGTCVLEDIFYVSFREGPVVGTVAIEPATGKELWRNAEIGGSQNLAGHDGKLLVLSSEKYYCCLSAKDGSLLWKQDDKVAFRYAAALGTDLIAGRKVIGWGRTNEAYRVDSGKPLPESGKLLLSSGDHGCGPLLLVSSGVTLSVSTSGLFAIDAKVGKTLWNSPGFGSTACANPTAANGRCFVNPQFNARIYCFEPDDSSEQK